MSENTTSSSVSQVNHEQNKVTPTLENKSAVNTGVKYDKMIKVALMSCAWLLSCVLLYTYNSKRASNIEYNKLITRMNTNKLETQMKTFRKKAEEYSYLAYPIKALDEDNEFDPTGIAKARKELYNELIMTVELYDKCNYIRLNTQGTPFPMTELMISCILLLIILSIILVSNLSNNPFKKLNLNEDITNIRESISKAMDDMHNDSKKEEVSSQSGGGTVNFKAIQLNKLTNLENTITNDINFLKSNSSFNYVSLSFSLIVFTVYISYKMLISSMRFRDNLYSGTTFMKSRCYDI
jgi:hypothetical protein